ncbi:MAG: hypothetical protein HYV40_03410, partial [Candidatus Levybacteria bacterium]|nr:hypothetical protein [Candidatus Levybacteria bacterium]MBI4097735.1 hypothetical protein [Candidatus Levybacteria bacterium]
MKKLHAVTWKEGKWYVAKAVEVEVASQGLSEKESLDNLREALELYFDDQDDADIISAKT